VQARWGVQAGAIETLAGARLKMRGHRMVDRPFNVLFLCTGNSARSIMAEAILNRLGTGRFHAYSAGGRPKGQVHPETLELLGSLGYETSGFRSKGWSEFAAPGAPPRSISFLRFVTTRRARPAPSGRVSR
jgi:hypothetical protein